MKYYLTLFCFLLVCQLSFSQYITYSDNIEISVLTCGPGEELYSTFGHSAFRIKDDYNHLDIVYNYGMFDFNAPNFYTNFAKGKLIYKLGRNRFSNFHEQYQDENRSVSEQILNLDGSQKRKLINYLEHNAQQENASYQYDFFYNNCATKIRSVLEDVFPNQLVFNDNHITSSYTMRQLINNNVPLNTWSNVGINIALGSVIDVKATTDDYQFLPEYIYKAFNNATLNNNRLVKINSVLLKNTTTTNHTSVSNNLTSPVFVFLLVFVLIVFITYKDYKARKCTKILDFILLFSTGLVGALVLLLWLATNHGTTANNLNILWAFAPNLFVAIFMFHKNSQKWFRLYFGVLITLLIVQTFIWLIKVEEFSIALIPLFIALFTRYCYLNYYYKS